MNRDELMRWIDEHARARVLHDAAAGRLLLRDEAERLDVLAEALSLLVEERGRGALDGEDPREAAEDLDDAFVEAIEGALPLRAVAGRGPCPLVGESDPDAFRTLDADDDARDRMIARGIVFPSEDGMIFSGDAWCAYARPEVLDEELDRHAAVVAYREEAVVGAALAAEEAGRRLADREAKSLPKAPDQWELVGGFAGWRPNDDECRRLGGQYWERVLAAACRRWREILEWKRGEDDAGHDMEAAS